MCRGDREDGYMRGSWPARRLADLLRRFGNPIVEAIPVDLLELQT